MKEILHTLYHSLMHSFEDSILILPFLFVTYLVMEAIEHSAGDRAKNIISRSGKVGPLAGALLGALPQCGFSAAAAGLYSGGVITVGTLLAVFLSTSDEMIPIMIAGLASVKTILFIVAVKAVLAAAAGFAADIVLRKRRKDVCISDICIKEGCNCEKGIWRSSLSHSLEIFVFIFLVNFILESVIGFVGEDTLASVVMSAPLLSRIIAPIVGLIPNCASSVIITELYIDGIISAGTMLAGLLAGSGIGVLVLFRTNKNKKECIGVLIFLAVFSAIAGTLFDIADLGAVLR